MKLAESNSFLYFLLCQGHDLTWPKQKYCALFHSRALMIEPKKTALFVWRASFPSNCQPRFGWTSLSLAPLYYLLRDALKSNLLNIKFTRLPVFIIRPSWRKASTGGLPKKNSVCCRRRRSDHSLRSGMSGPSSLL